MDALLTARTFQRTLSACQEDNVNCCPGQKSVDDGIYTTRKSNNINCNEKTLRKCLVSLRSTGMKFCSHFEITATLNL
jgi:hypothetical protein